MATDYVYVWIAYNQIDTHTLYLVSDVTSQNRSTPSVCRQIDWWQRIWGHRGWWRRSGTMVVVVNVFTMKLCVQTHMLLKIATLTQKIESCSRIERKKQEHRSKIGPRSRICVYVYVFEPGNYRTIDFAPKTSTIQGFCAISSIITPSTFPPFCYHFIHGMPAVFSMPVYAGHLTLVCSQKNNQTKAKLFHPFVDRLRNSMSTWPEPRFSCCSLVRTTCLTNNTMKWSNERMT